MNFRVSLVASGKIKAPAPNFVHHFLPSIEGHEPKEDIDINEQLQKYFKFMFGCPSRLVITKKSSHAISSFLVTVPDSFRGELPPELKGVPQLEVSVVAQDPPAAPAQAAAAAATEEKGA